MLGFQNAAGEQGKLTAGCMLLWYPQRGFFMMKDADGTYFNWNGVEKYAEFFNTPEEFVAFANFFASLYNLDTRHPSIGRVPTWVEFISPATASIERKTIDEQIQDLSKATAFSDGF